MRKELIDELRKRHPRLLGAAREPGTQPSILCGDGWFNLLDCLCGALVADRPSGDAPQIRVAEIKSKYGGLRFHALGLDATGEAQVALAEALSERTCEACGCPGVAVDRAGWISTTCELHMQPGANESNSAGA